METSRSSYSAASHQGSKINDCCRFYEFCSAIRYSSFGKVDKFDKSVMKILTIGKKKRIIVRAFTNKRFGINGIRMNKISILSR